MTIHSMTYPSFVAASTHAGAGDNCEGVPYGGAAFVMREGRLT